MKIEIGDFTISNDTGRDGGLWISYDDCEGMQISEEEFNEWLKQFWKDNF